MYKEKLEKVIQLIKENHLDINIKYTDKEINNIINMYLEKYNLNEKCEFYHVVNSIINDILEPYDSHTHLNIILKSDEKYPPFHFDYYGNKPYITYTTKEYEKYIGSELLKINGIDISIIETECKKMIVHENVSSFKRQIVWYFNTLSLLKMLSIFKDIGNVVTYTLKNNNKIFDIKIDINKIEDSTVILDRMYKNYTYDKLNDNLVIHYTKCRENYTGQMNEFVEKIKNEHGINSYILDLRNNSGGDSSIFLPLLNFLKDKNVVVLVNHNVFSGGIWAAYIMQDLGFKVIGEEVGDIISNFANSPSYVIDDDFKLNISNKFFYFDKHRFNSISDKKEFIDFKNSDYEKNF